MQGTACRARRAESREGSHDGAATCTATRTAAHAAPQASFLYATSHGAYAGVSYEGAAFFSRRDVNRAFYGEHHAIDDIIGGRIPRPAVAQPLYDILAKSSADFQRVRSGVDDDGQY